MQHALIVQEPSGQARQLVLLFHGVGSSARSMVPVGALLADALPGAAVASVEGAEPSDLGAGRQWFSVRGITEENRRARVEAAMPSFQAAARTWQDRHQVGAADTVLIGFSQGAIMALESTRAGGKQLAARVVSIAGRFAHLPDRPLRGVSVNFLHGQQDSAIAAALAIAAAERLAVLGSDVTIDLFPSAGHEITAEMAAKIGARLKGNSPR